MGWYEWGGTNGVVRMGWYEWGGARACCWVKHRLAERLQRSYDTMLLLPGRAENESVFRSSLASWLERAKEFRTPERDWQVGN